MKNKVMKKILMIMLSSTILMGSASVTAFAQANENAEQTEAVEQVIEEQPAEQPTTEETPFSTPGNGQLVDDKENDSSKQFLTVQTKKYFVKTDAKVIIPCERHRIKIPTLGWVRLKEKGYIPTNPNTHTIIAGTCITFFTDIFSGFFFFLIFITCKRYSG